MEYLLTNPFILTFIILPPTLMILKHKNLLKMNVFLIFIFQLLSGWMFINGGNFYYDIQLKNELEKHNYDYDAIHDANEQLSPEIKEILTAITGDGGRNVFTLYFGWVYSIFYFIPYLIIFKIISYIKKKLSCNAAI